MGQRESEYDVREIPAVGKVESLYLMAQESQQVKGEGGRINRR